MSDLTFGVLPGGATPEEFLASVQVAEELGYDSVWVGDHVLWPVFWPEPVVLLSAAAAVTSRIGLGTGVMLAGLRGAAPLAKQTATLQWISNGRFRLGVGAGGEYAKEFEASGVPLADRGRRLDDTLEAVRALLKLAPFRFDPSNRSPRSSMPFRLAPGKPARVSEERRIVFDPTLMEIAIATIATKE